MQGRTSGTWSTWSPSGRETYKVYTSHVIYVVLNVGPTIDMFEPSAKATNDCHSCFQHSETEAWLPQFQATLNMNLQANKLFSEDSTEKWEHINCCHRNCKIHPWAQKSSASRLVWWKRTDHPASARENRAFIAWQKSQKKKKCRISLNSKQFFGALKTLSMDLPSQDLPTC